MKHNNKFKKGATSIYVVVIASLLFSVITVSFIRIIINEANKTAEDELAQSAYDSALAGVEDTKTALKRYYECKSATGEKPEGCIDLETTINYGFEMAENYCDSIADALGRFSISEEGIKEVLIQEKENSHYDADAEHIVQAYTCVTIDSTLDDYRASLSSSNTIEVIPLRTSNVASVTGVRIKWYTETNGESLNYANKDNFGPAGQTYPTPPTLTAQIIQTGPTFTLADFSDASGDNTDRGTVVLVPTNSGNKTHVTKDIVVASNNHSYDRTTINEPQKIKCENGSSDGFACVATIELPDPKGGQRNRETFYLVLALPYGGPNTAFAVQLCTDEGGINDPRGDCVSGGEEKIAKFEEVQIAVDATGRANDMYSRVEARVEFKDAFPYPEFVVQAIGDSEEAIKKNFYVTSDCINSENGSVNTECSNTGDA